jgi:hypothetical protein
LQLGKFAMFAQWDDDQALEHFLAEDQLGRRLASGWHVRCSTSDASDPSPGWAICHRSPASGATTSPSSR